MNKMSNKPMRKTNLTLKMLNNLLLDLPAPMNLSIMWNWGSLLSFMLIIQILTGSLLAMHYTPHILLAYDMMIHIMNNINMGWVIRLIHVNGASMYFIFLYMHMGRNMYYHLYSNKLVWYIGYTIFLLSMMTAFMGYILPWGQMSLWGATVITNMFSTIPYLGGSMVQWIWGGYSVGNPTLNRFFVLHFMLPFIILLLVMNHIMYLHKSGSSNPLGVNSSLMKIPFHPYYSSKDLFLIIIMMVMMSFIFMLNPNLFMDSENMIEANFMKTPIHIKPEWYFLWLYAMLRSIPNKLGGVVTMAMALIILLLLPMISKYNHLFFMSAFNKFLFWLMILNFMLLTWIGNMAVLPIFQLLGLFSTILYFLLMFLYLLLPVYFKL
uniref:Cytochrome b n=1 Tax=Endomyzostoma sp. MZ-2009 TaxID=644517 RepID=C7BG54_9ANNE|nr:cytochrome b [Endomyzostoma sp. MZ-2009]